MGNKSCKPKQAAGHANHSDSDDENGSDPFKMMAAQAWKEMKDGTSMTSSLKPEDIQTTPVEEDKQEHPAFLDGKGKLWDGAGKRWIPIKQAERPARGLERVTKTFPSGNRYEGEMLNGKYHGTGLLSYADGRMYKGQWVEGTMHGRGVFNYANGDVYKGEYFGGKQEGQGTFTWKNGDRYVGAWKNGQRHGKGVLSKKSGDGYNGMWKDGAPDMQLLKNVHR